VGDYNNDFLMIEKDIYPKAAAAGKLFGYKIKSGKWYDCGTLIRWEKAIKEWRL
jgi:NDP-sugar pyrophosphorylase family protein